MKKSLYIKFIIMFLLAAGSAYAQIPQLKNWANDLTGTLSQAELEELNSDLKTFQDSTSNQIVFLVVPSLDGNAIEDYSYQVADQNKIGTKEHSNGILFLIAKNDKKDRIEVGYGLEGALPDAITNSILRHEVHPLFKQGKYYEGIKSGLEAIKAATKGEYKAKKTKNNAGSMIKGIFMLIAVILFIIFRFFGGGGRHIFYGGGPGGGYRSSGWGGFGGGGFGGGSFGGGGGSSGWGGFSGGGGSFGGGGSSGSW